MNPTVQLLNELYLHGEYGYYWLVDIQGRKQTVWFKADAIPDPPQAVAVYYGVHPVKSIPVRLAPDGAKVPARNVRPRLDEIQLVNCLFCEFDVKAISDPKPLEWIYNRLADRPTPSVVLHSGGGIHALWFLHRTVNVTPENRAAIRATQASWVKYMGGDTGAKDLSRVLRAPGSLNNKYDPPRRVETIHFDTDTRYDLGDLYALCYEETPVDTLPSVPAHDASASVALRGIERFLRDAREGERHQKAIWAAVKMAEHGVDQATAIQTIMACVQGKDFSEREVVKIVEWGYTRT